MIRIDRVGNVDVVTFTIDRINALLTDELREQVTRLYENPGSKVIIDLKGVDYIDSTGFSCLLSCFRESKNNYGIFKISSPEPSVLRLFEVLHLNTVFDICSSTEEALKSFR